VLKALHPTPAVCGHPRDTALRAIRSSETFDRGLYAGPLGWVGADSAEFVVAIRSALISPAGDEVMLYAGVGVVASADSAVRPGIKCTSTTSFAFSASSISFSFSSASVSTVFGPHHTAAANTPRVPKHSGTIWDRSGKYLFRSDCSLI